jgi:type II secretory pathway component PulJ
MSFDEILLITVLVMLIASTFMAWSVLQSSLRSRQAFEALVKEIGAMGLATLDLDRRLETLEYRVKELENERT